MTEVVEVDPHDEQALRAWHDVYLEAETHERPFAAPWMFEEVRAAAQAPPLVTRRILLAGLEDGEVVSVAQAVLPLRDNRTTAALMVHTRPPHRLRGHASALLTALEERLAREGRTVLTATTDHAHDLGPSGAGDPGVELLRARGFELALSDVQRTLDLPVPAGRLAALAGVPTPYTLRTFRGPVPGDLVASYGRLIGMLVTEAPTGGLVVEPEVYDEERIRAEERLLEEGGRTRYVTVALTGDEVVAYTEVAVPRHVPGRAYQQGTLVLAAHRGHRLGTAVKAAVLTFLQEQDPQVREVVTYNAEVNRHMIRVNELLGFRPTARLAELQKRLR